MIINRKQVYKQVCHRNSKMSYSSRRLEHFHDSLKMFDIPIIAPDILDLIKVNIVKPVTQKTIIHVLRKLGLFQLFDHVFFIQNHLLGLHHDVGFPDNVKVELVDKFKSVAMAFDVYNVKIGHMTSFFNRTFILTKLVEGMHDMQDMQDMQEFPEKSQILLQLDRFKIKSVEKKKMYEDKWNCVMQLVNVVC